MPSAGRDLLARRRLARTAVAAALSELVSEALHEEKASTRRCIVLRFRRVAHFFSP